MIGLGNANQSIGWSPLLQESVPIANPTCVPTGALNCATSSTSPTITSGPGTRFGTPGPTACCMGGMTIDFVSPLTSWSIWIGCIAAPMEIVPANEPASDGIPSVLANCFERRSLPPVMRKRLRSSIVIVLVSFNIEKSESCIAIAHCKIEALT